MNNAEHLRKLTELQVALDKTLERGRNSFAYTITRPKLIAELKRAVEKARKVGITEEDIDELVVDLEMETGKRPVELEYFWDPWRISKGYRKKRQGQARPELK